MLRRSRPGHIFGWNQHLFEQTHRGLAVILPIGVAQEIPTDMIASRSAVEIPAWREKEEAAGDAFDHVFPNATASARRSSTAP